MSSVKEEEEEEEEEEELSSVPFLFFSRVTNPKY